MLILEIFFEGDFIAKETIIKETNSMAKLNNGLNLTTSKALTPSPFCILLYK